MEQIKATKKKSLFKIISMWAGVAVLFFLISLAMLFIQVHSSADQISGKITSINQNEIIIVDAQGATTSLMINTDTKIRESTSQLSPGTYIHSIGTKTSDNTFQSRGIRVIKADH